MANKVLFSRGFSTDFNRIAVKDPNTLYFLTDSHQLYLGDVRYGFDAMNVITEGEGDFVSAVQFDSTQKAIIVRLDGKAGELASVTEAIQNAVNECVASVKADVNSAIKVEGTKDITIGLNLAPVGSDNNVTLFQDAQGLKAKVDIPDAGIVAVKANDALLYDVDGIIASSELMIETEDLNGVQYIRLKARKPGSSQAVELASLDVSQFIRDSFVEDVKIVTNEQGIKVIRFTIKTVEAQGHESKKDIDVPISDLIGGIYTGQNSISVSNDYVISIDNTVEAYTGSDIGESTVSFGDSIAIPVVTYNQAGLITGKKELKFNLPTTSGSIGGEGQIVTSASIVDGVLNGTTITLDATVTQTATSVPTSKAVYDAIQDASVRWSTLS